MAFMVILSTSNSTIHEDWNDYPFLTAEDKSKWQIPKLRAGISDTVLLRILLAGSCLVFDGRLASPVDFGVYELFYGPMLQLLYLE
jgi:hypothetical protein